jgi:hypothetical protein
VRVGGKGSVGSMDIDEQLRSTSDRILETLEQLQLLETEKRSLVPGSRRFQKLAREVERLADSMVAHAEEQTELANEAAELGQPAPPIDEQPRDVTTILAEWREAERHTTATHPGSADEISARADVDRLRAEYQRAHRAASRRATRSDP